MLNLDKYFKENTNRGDNMRKFEIVRSSINSDSEVLETVKEFSSLEEAQTELRKYKNNNTGKFTIRAYTVDRNGNRVNGSEFHIRKKL